MGKLNTVTKSLDRADFFGKKRSSLLRLNLTGGEERIITSPAVLQQDQRHGRHSHRAHTPSHPGPNVIKLFTAVLYECSLKARAFVPGKPFQPSLLIVRLELTHILPTNIRLDQKKLVRDKYSS